MIKRFEVRLTLILWKFSSESVDHVMHVLLEILQVVHMSLGQVEVLGVPWLEILSLKDVLLIKHGAEPRF